MTETLLKIDLDAPIHPAEGAAGLQLESNLSDYERPDGEAFTVVECDDSVVYRSASVDVWATAGKVTQICVSGTYRGSLSGQIRLGAPFAAVEQLLGQLGEDEYDNLVVEGVPGVGFEVAETIYVKPSYSPEWLSALRKALVGSICVWPTRHDRGRDARLTPTARRGPGCNTLIFQPIEHVAEQ